MSRSERLTAILEHAAVGADSSVAALTERFNVTASTIRRDLADLQNQGKLMRVLGGAVAAPDAEPSLRERLGDAYVQKQAIARAALDIIKPHEVIYLDAGSTVGALAEEIRQSPDHSDLTVVTSSIVVIQALSGRPDITVHCTGGTMRSVSGAMLGPLTEAAVRSFRFDHAFFGADGVDPEHGLCEAELAQTSLKELVAVRSRNVCVVAHAAKLYSHPFPCWARLGENWLLITDQGGTEAAPRFADRNIRVHIA